MVAIRKRRGPYVDMLDLPGGAPLPNETAIETLRRELCEECGVNNISVSSWHNFDFRIEESSAGYPIELRHHGLIALVTVSEEVHLVQNVEDVRNIELIDPTQHASEELTPALAFAISLLRP